MIIALALAVLSLTSACSAEPAVTLGGERFTVEIAADLDSRSLGLMYREEMAADQGMLFLFPDQRPRSFWMKNTKISLDILYFDRDFKLVGMQLSVPPCRQSRCPGYPSGRPAMYVLELNAGTAVALGVKSGDLLTVHGELPKPR